MVVCVLKLGGIGDILMVTPGLRGLRKSFPHDRICFITGRTNRQVLARSPYVDELVIVDDGRIFGRSFSARVAEVARLFWIIRRTRPGVLFVLHRDWRWNLLALLAGVPKRYGFARDLKGLFLSRSVSIYSTDHEIHKYLKLFEMRPGYRSEGTDMEIFPSPHDHTSARALLGPFRDRLLVAIAPGGASNVRSEMKSRRWPLMSYRHLIETLLEEREDLVILLAGGRSDRKLTSSLLIDHARVIDLAGRTSIQQTYLFLRCCRVLVTNDSGTMHMGAAAGIPVVSIFGPTAPAELRPLTSPSDFALWKGRRLSCAPCYSEGRFPECETHECMHLVSVEDVLAKVLSLLSGDSF
ncbi:glycosyltransferase family 9 protein [Thermodesulfobacteriota bacterium]